MKFTVSILLAGMMLLAGKDAFAQTRAAALTGIRLQAGLNGTNALTLGGPATGFTASYSILFPAAAPGIGALPYLIDGSGQLGWFAAPVAIGSILTFIGGIPAWSTTLTLRNPLNTFSSTFTSGAQLADINYILPMVAPTAGQVLSSTAGGVMSWVSGGGGTVTSVSGTTNRITVATGTTTPVIDISSAYVGQTSLTTLGTITTGTWNGTSIADANVDNNLTISGGTITNSPISGSTVSTTGLTLAGTTSTITLNAAVGTSGQVLTSAGAGVTPTWTTPTTGTVTSVGLTVPGVIFNTPVSGSPVTGSGTLGLTLNTQTANTVFAGPSSGAAATPTFRALVLADLPSGDATGTGTVNTLPKWSNTTGGLVNSSLLDNGTTVSTGENLSLTGAGKTLLFTGTFGTGTSSFTAGNQSGISIAYTLPTALPTTNQVLTATGVSGSNVTMGWATGSGSSGSTISSTYLARSPIDVSTVAGATTLVDITGLKIPLAAGEAWAFEVTLSAIGPSGSQGIDVAATFPAGGIMEATSFGFADNGSTGHATSFRHTTSGQRSGTVNPYLAAANLEGNIRFSGIIDNTNGAAGSLQLQVGGHTTGASAGTVYKNSFITAWKYATFFDQTYTASTAITIPAGVTKIYISGAGAAGGGGGGGGENANANKNGGGGGGGGGAGQYFKDKAITVTPGDVLTITIGAGGAGGSAGVGATSTAAGAGGNGGVTTIVNQSAVTIFSANGGTGGGAGGLGVQANVGAAGALGAGGVVAGSTPAGGVAGVSGSAGIVGNNNTATQSAGGSGGNDPTPSTNTGGNGGAGFESTLVVNGNGVAGSVGSNGFVLIAY